MHFVRLLMDNEEGLRHTAIFLFNLVLVDYLGLVVHQLVDNFELAFKTVMESAALVIMLCNFEGGYLGTAFMLRVRAWNTAACTA